MNRTHIDPKSHEPLRRSGMPHASLCVFFAPDIRASQRRPDNELPCTLTKILANGTVRISTALYHQEGNIGAVAFRDTGITAKELKTILLDVVMISIVSLDVSLRSSNDIDVLQRKLADQLAVPERPRCPEWWSQRALQPPRRLGETQRQVNGLSS